MYNMIYRLDALEAYNKRLVKKIAVKGISVTGSTATEGYSLFDNSGELAEYKDGYTVLRIDGRDSSVEFTNGKKLPYSPKALRSSAGAVFSIRVEYVECLGVLLIASSPHSTISYRSVQYKRPLALLVGNEASGLSDEMLKAADLKVSIPLKGEVESLNASVAAAVLLFEIIRK